MSRYKRKSNVATLSNHSTYKQRISRGLKSYRFLNLINIFLNSYGLWTPLTLNTIKLHFFLWLSCGLELLELFDRKGNIEGGSLSQTCLYPYIASMLLDETLSNG
jgi:hypothetical protein